VERPEIILLRHQVLCLFCTVSFTSELIAKRHSLSFRLIINQAIRKQPNIWQIKTCL